MSAKTTKIRAAARHTALAPKATMARRFPSPYKDILALQRMAGNQAVNYLLRDEVPATGGSVVRGGAGRSLDPGTREEMESRFGTEFGDVRIHTGSNAAAAARYASAQAFTIGSEIVFGENKYDPQGIAGLSLLAHELAHVIQQRRGGVTPRLNDAADHEAAARAAADAIATGAESIVVRGATGIGLARQADPTDAKERILHALSELRKLEALRAKLQQQGKSLKLDQTTRAYDAVNLALKKAEASGQPGLVSEAKELIGRLDRVTQSLPHPGLDQARLKALASTPDLAAENFLSSKSRSVTKSASAKKVTQKIVREGLQIPVDVRIEKHKSASPVARAMGLPGLEAAHIACRALLGELPGYEYGEALAWTTDKRINTEIDAHWKAVAQGWARKGITEVRFGEIYELLLTSIDKAKSLTNREKGALQDALRYELFSSGRWNEDTIVNISNSYRNLRKSAPELSEKTTELIGELSGKTHRPEKQQLSQRSGRGQKVGSLRRPAFRAAGGALSIISVISEFLSIRKSYTHDLPAIMEEARNQLYMDLGGKAEWRWGRQGQYIKYSPPTRDVFVKWLNENVRSGEELSKFLDEMRGIALQRGKSGLGTFFIGGDYNLFPIIDQFLSTHD